MCVVAVVVLLFGGVSLVCMVFACFLMNNPLHVACVACRLLVCFCSL